MTFPEEMGEPRLHHETTEGDLPVLVLSHALGTNLTLWEPQLQAFAKHFRVLRYDARGHGQSSAPADPYTLDDLGQDVLRLLDKLGLERVHFCGLSLGGVVGQWLGVNATERLHKLVLCNTAAKIGTDESWNARIDAVQREGLRPMVPSILERWYTEDFRNNSPRAVASTGEMLLASDVDGYAATCAALRDMDLRQSVSRIVAPALVIAGKHDPVTPPDDCRWLRNEIAGAAYVELDAAHLSNVEAAGAFNATVVDFLKA